MNALNYGRLTNAPDKQHTHRVQLHQLQGQLKCFWPTNTYWVDAYCLPSAVHSLSPLFRWLFCSIFFFFLLHRHGQLFHSTVTCSINCFHYRLSLSTPSLSTFYPCECITTRNKCRSANKIAFQVTACLFLVAFFISRHCQHFDRILVLR